MTPEQAEKFRYNVLDLTKVWPHKEFPLRQIGTLTLNENPQNYFAGTLPLSSPNWQQGMSEWLIGVIFSGRVTVEVEQSAFSPSHLIPGIEPSADPVLQSRLFSYPDTHRHRLGTNYQQLPVNCPVAHVANFREYISLFVRSITGLTGLTYTHS